MLNQGKPVLFRGTCILNLGKPILEKGNIIRIYL